MTALAKILLVDDEPQVLVALQDVLEDEYTVLKSDSAEQALRMIRDVEDIAVLLTDQRMPGMTGDDLLSKLGVECAAQRILVTGYADLSAVVRAINEGRVFAYITKPWDTRDLRSKVGSAVDHYRVSRKLEHERRLLQDLMNNAPDGIAIRGAERRFQRVNPAFVDLVGARSPGQLVGRRLEEVLTSKNAAMWCDEDERVLATGEPLVDAIRVYGSTSEPRWISETVAPIRGSRGEAIGLVNIARDVSDRVRAEQALRAEEQRFREQSTLLNSILDSMGDGVVVADTVGRLQFFNRKAEQMLGGPSDGRCLEDWASAFGLRMAGTHAVPTRLEDPLARAIAGEPNPVVDLVLKRPNHPDVLISAKASSLRTSEGTPAGAVALLRDVTLHHQLMQSQKLEALGQLAGGIAHDFNNVLAAIQSYAHLAQLSVESDHACVEDLGEIVKATQRASRLTRQLLVFGRRRVVEPTPTALNDVVLELEDMLHRLIGEHIVLTTELAPEVGEVHVDEGQLEQLIMNLVLNARDAMATGGELKISTRIATPVGADAAVAAAPAVLLVISDTGTGMSDDIKSRVFEPFFTTKGPGQGTGLGLATVYGIVRECQGSIHVDTRLGKGTTFSITIPAAGLPARIHGVSSAPPLRRSETARTILLVEDDVALRAATARLLESRGFKVVVAGDALHAKELCASVAIDLVLTDVVMPQLSGPSLANELQEVQTGLRVLFMSGYAETKVGDAALLDETAVVLEKPFSPDQLMLSIRSVLAD
jgi:PAS domain S-box-containing protein